MPKIILNIHRDEVVIDGQKGRDDCIEGEAETVFEEDEEVTNED